MKKLFALIAVFGMRIIFPIIIVAIVAAVTPYAAAKIAFTDPDLYAKIMHDSHIAVAAFGGTFLLMVFLKFRSFPKKEKTRRLAGCAATTISFILIPCIPMSPTRKAKHSRANKPFRWAINRCLYSRK